MLNDMEQLTDNGKFTSDMLLGISTEAELIECLKMVNAEYEVRNGCVFASVSDTIKADEKYFEIYNNRLSKEK